MNIAEISTTYKGATILSGASTTEAIELEHGQSLIGIFHPVMNTSVSFGFEVSEDGKVYSALEDGNGAPFNVGFDNSNAGYTPIAYPEIFRGFRFLKITVADNQTSNRTLRLAVKPSL